MAQGDCGRQRKESLQLGTVTRKRPSIKIVRHNLIKGVKASMTEGCPLAEMGSGLIA